jgi:hypothetical protein
MHCNAEQSNRGDGGRSQRQEDEKLADLWLVREAILMDRHQAPGRRSPISRLFPYRGVTQLLSRR